MDTTTNIGPIDGQDIIYCPDQELVTYSSKGDCDCDGPGGSLKMDPDWQPETTLQWFNPATGKKEFVNSCLVPGIVVSQVVCRKTRPKILGSLGSVSFDNGPWIPCVCYDIGDDKNDPRLGEFSYALHKMANTGGTPMAVPEGVRYRTRIHCGVPASVLCVDGVTRHFALQSFQG